MSLTTKRAEEKKENERQEGKAKSDILIAGRLQTSINSKPSLVIPVSGFLCQGLAISQRPIMARPGSLSYSKK